MNPFSRVQQRLPVLPGYPCGAAALRPPGRSCPSELVHALAVWASLWSTGRRQPVGKAVVNSGDFEERKDVTNAREF